MSNSIDTRIVEMKFDNTQFEQAAKQSLGTLDALNKNLKMDGAAKGLQDVNEATKRFSLQSIAQGVESIQQKFSAMSVIAITALSNIVTKAMSAGAQLVKSFTIAPIMAGFQEYELKMGSIQTILSNTSRYGTTLKEVTANLDELNTYADKTIYNFGDMTKNIGLFTNAGIRIKDATSMIKGFSNEAASSGTSAQGAAGAAYQLSQALSAGTIRLMDWRSLTNVGMGNKNMQRGLIEIADAMGMFTKKQMKASDATKDFNGSLEKKWLSADVMQKYLKIQAGELSDAQMKNIGLTEKQVKAFKKQAKIAQDAATKVRTGTQLMGTLKEAVGSSWTETFDIIIGDFNEATKLWTNVNDVLSGIIGDMGKRRNNLLKGWDKLGGRAAGIEAVSNAFHALLAFMKPIQQAWREIFPRTTAQDLFNITDAIRDFTAKLKIGGDTAQKLKRTFAGVFAIFGIGWEVIKAIARGFAELFSSASEGSGSILDITAKIGDFLVKLHEAIKNGDGLTNFFKNIGKYIALPIKYLRIFATWLSTAFDNFDGIDTSSLDGLGARFAQLGAVGKFIGKVWNGVKDVISGVWKAFKPLASAFADWIGDIGSAIADGMKTADFSGVLSLINTGLFAGVLLLLKKFVKNGLKISGSLDIGDGLFGKLGGAFDALTGSLTAMQTSLKAKALLRIAGAIAILTISVVALSMIDSEALTKALAAITVMFTQLFASMAIFEKVTASKGFSKMPVVAGAMILLAVAIDLLAIAVKKLSDLGWEELGKGLAGVTVLIAALAGAMNLMPGQKRMISTGIGMILLATGIRILVGAVTDLSGLSWEELAKGLVGVGAMLGALGLFVRFANVDKMGISSGAGLILLAVGVKILADAIGKMSGFSWEEIAKGLGTTAGGLLAMAGALKLLPPSSLLSAAGIFIVASSLGMINDAVKDMGNISWDVIGRGVGGLAGGLGAIAIALAALPPTTLLSAAAIFIVASSLGMITTALGTMGGQSWTEIAKGLVTLAGALGIIAAAMALMTTAIFGAAALIVVAGALAILAPILIKFGDMSWGEIVKGLVMLAGVLTVIGVAGALLTPVVPTLLGLGVAIGLLGIGLAAAGAGILLFSIGLTAIAASGGAAAAVIISIVRQIIGVLPEIAVGVGLALIALAKVIATAGPAITAAVTTLITALLNAIIRLTPKVVQTMLTLLKALIKVVTTAVPLMVEGGMRLITGILRGIAKNIGKMVKAAADVVVNFLNGLAKQLPRIIQAGVNFILKFVNGVANAIRNNSGRMRSAGVNLATAVLGGVGGGIAAGLGAVLSKGKQIATSAIKGITGGISRGLGSVLSHAKSLAGKVLTGIGSGISAAVSKGKQLVTSVINAITGGLSNAAGAVLGAAKGVAGNIISGMVSGIRGGISSVTSAAKGIASSALSAAKNFLGIHSPSREFAKLGRFSALGYSHGLRRSKPEIQRAHSMLREELSETMKAAAKDITRLQARLKTLNNARHRNVAAIRSTRKALAQAHREYNRTSAALKVANTYQDETNKLKRIRGQIDATAKRLESANKRLADAKKVRDDYNKSLKDQYYDLPEVTVETKYGDYVKDMQKQIQDTKLFTAQLKKLRSMGLGDKMYRELLSKGTEAMPFAQQVLEGGRGRVKELNTLGSALSRSASALASNASRALYQAGVDAAAGLVKGLQKQQTNLKRQMNNLADSMVRTIKKKLGIRSPSREFMKVGDWSVKGLAKGLEQSSAATSAAEDVGLNAINAMRKTLTGLSDIVDGEIDANPTIKPVLDLTKLQKDAGLIDTMLTTKPLEVSGAYSQARSTSAALKERRMEDYVAAAASAAPGDNLTFNQYNNSPKALSEAEIYRNTKNQLSRAKGALK